MDSQGWLGKDVSTFIQQMSALSKKLAGRQEPAKRVVQSAPTFGMPMPAQAGDWQMRNAW